MKLSMDRSIDDPGLEAGVLIAKGNRGCHDDNERAGEFCIGVRAAEAGGLYLYFVSA
jgi:hypothetical protein